MLGRHAAHGFVVHPDEIRRQAGKTPVDQHVGPFAFLDAPERLHGPLRGGDNQRVHTAGKHLVDLLPLQFRALFGRGNQQAVALDAQRAGKALGHFGEERMHQIGNHQADGERAAGNQGASRQVRLVVQLLHSLEHALPGFIADVLVIPEDLRDGHDGNAEIPGDVLHSDGHAPLWQ